MKKHRKNNTEAKNKIRTGPKFLTILLLLALLSCIAVDCYCAYDLLGGRIVSSSAGGAGSEDELTEEELEAKEEREKEEEEELQRLESGKFIFDTSMLEDIEQKTVSGRRDAAALLSQIGDGLGITDAAQEYSFSHSDETDYNNYYVMQQKYNGFEVSGSTITIQTDKLGEIIGIFGQYIPTEGFDTDITVSRNEAGDAAGAYVESEYGLEPDGYRLYNVETKIFNIDSEKLVVGYEIDVIVGDITIVSLVIDGKTGEVAGISDDIVYEMQSMTLDGQKEEQTLDVYKSSNSKFVLEDRDRKIKIYFNDRSNTTVEKSKLNKVLEASWNPADETPDGSCVDALANLQKTYDFYKDVYQITGVQNKRSFTLPVYVGITNLKTGNITDNWLNNAGMYGNSSMVIGTRSNGSAEYSASFNVMAHEYTHGVTYTLCSLAKGQYSSGNNRQKSAQLGINEAIADIFAELAEDYINDKQFDGDCDWENDVRNFNSPAVQKYSDFKVFSTDCHDSMSLVTYPFYLMANGSGETIGTETLSNLFYDIIHSLNSQTDFVSFRNIFERNAAQMTAQNYIQGPNKDGRVLTDGQLETVVDAFDRVGIPTSFDKTVVSGGTLKVYGKDNKVYDNYNIKIRRLQNTAVNILDEDVHEKSYTIPSSVPNGIYSVLLTDLAAPSLTETFTLVINNNAADQNVGKYPDAIKAHTNFGALPRDVVLVLDVSGSMSGNPIAQTRYAAEKFVDTVLSASPATRISIVTYSSGVSVPVQMSNKKSALKGAISRLGANGGTNIYDALDTAKNILDTSDTAKKIIVLMSDGQPNTGQCDAGGDYESPIRRLADGIRDSGVTIYTLGFFHNLSGSDLMTCQKLMYDIATSGYNYVVDNAADIDFDVENPESDLYKVFNDFAEMINGKKYINIRIACPVDVTVTYNGETITSKSDGLSTRASFGSLFFEKLTDENGEETEDDPVKILRLDESADYEIFINGTGRGTMNYTISYPDNEGEYTDVRKFRRIPITKDTFISTATESADGVKMNVDTDGDGKFDLNYSAGRGKSAELKNSKTTQLIIAVSVVVSVLFVILLIIKAVFLVKRIKFGGVCAKCGTAVENDEKFCHICGEKVNGKPVYLEGSEMVHRQSKAAIIVKLTLTVICIGMTTAVLFAYDSAATNVFRQLRGNKTESAKMIYDSSVSDSGISKLYLSAITGRYLERAQKAYRDGKFSEDDYCELLRCVKELNIGSASEKADGYLEELK